VAELHFVEESAAGVAAGEAFEAVALKAGIDRVVDLVRREKHPAKAINADRIGSLRRLSLSAAQISVAVSLAEAGA